jgi:hypothetical protein
MATSTQPSLELKNRTAPSLASRESRGGMCSDLLSQASVKQQKKTKTNTKTQNVEHHGQVRHSCTSSITYQAFSYHLLHPPSRAGTIRRATHPWF